jgi:hypothetical protein
MATKQTNSRTTPATKSKKSEAPAPATGVMPKSERARESVTAKSETSAAANRNGAPEKRAPSHDAIAERAFALYQARGREGGSPDEDWLAAERELSA